MTRNQIIPFLTFALAAIFAISYLFAVRQVSASAPAGLPATASTSNAIVSQTPSTVVATTTNCAARVISTASSSITLTFTDRTAQSPSATFGHLQLASTTIVYDGGQFGCGLIKAYSFTPQVITVTDSK